MNTKTKSSYIFEEEGVKDDDKREQRCSSYPGNHHDCAYDKHHDVGCCLCGSARSGNTRSGRDVVDAASA